MSRISKSGHCEEKDMTGPLACRGNKSLFLPSRLLSTGRWDVVQICGKRKSVQSSEMSVARMLKEYPASNGMVKFRLEEHLSCR